MSASSYLVWFVAMAVFTGVLLGVGIVAATGYWSSEERSARAAPRRRRREVRLESAQPEARTEARPGSNRGRHRLPMS